MIKEHDCVVLTQDLPGHPLLQSGSVGTVVHIHQAGVAYEVEFIANTGKTMALVAVRASQLRLVLEEDETTNLARG